MPQGKSNQMVRLWFAIVKSDSLLSFLSNVDAMVYWFHFGISDMSFDSLFHEQSNDTKYDLDLWEFGNEASE